MKIHSQFITEDALEDSRVASTAAEAGRETSRGAKAGGRRVNDGWIKSKVYSQFLTDNTLENSGIDVDVRNGVVTLNGTVASDAGRSRAVAIAKPLMASRTSRTR